MWAQAKAASMPLKQESHAVARKPRDTAAVVFGLKFADNVHYKFKSSQLHYVHRAVTKLNKENQYNFK